MTPTAYSVQQEVADGLPGVPDLRFGLESREKQLVVHVDLWDLVEDVVDQVPFHQLLFLQRQVVLLPNENK